MKDFAAIDFETANGKRTSVCSVGVVVVRGGEVTDSFYSLIRPRPNFYSRFTTAIHGLTYDDTAEAPDFETVWKQIAPRIEGLPLVAHNSPFDEGCLRAVFELYGMPYPGYRFYCTCRASRRTITWTSYHPASRRESGSATGCAALIRAPACVFWVKPWC
jgi:DNA polymerase-3 subunit epsilon